MILLLHANRSTLRALSFVAFTETVPERNSLKMIRNQRGTWCVPASTVARNTHNPIRKLVDGMNLVPNKDKEMIALSIGEFHSPIL